jgi:hypothetical protein
VPTTPMKEAAVPPTVAHSELIAKARREIRALKRPKQIRRDLWTGMIDILVVIAGYLPDPYPSQRTIAAKLDLHRTTVTRRVLMAERLGLINRTDRPNPGGLMDGTTYHLVCLSEPLKLALSRTHFQDTLCTQTQSSFSEGRQDEATSSGGGISRPAAPAVQTPQENVVPFNRNTDDDWSSPAIGEDPKGALPATTIKVDPAVYLARRFDAKWAEARRRAPALRVTRASSRGRAVGNARSMMRDNGLSPEHVEAYMDAFIDACVAGDVFVKEGQFAWERFFGWWGTTDVEDPAERHAAASLAQQMIEQARQIRGESG